VDQVRTPRLHKLGFSADKPCSFLYHRSRRLIASRGAHVWSGYKCFTEDSICSLFYMLYHNLLVLVATMPPPLNVPQDGCHHLVPRQRRARTVNLANECTRDSTHSNTLAFILSSCRFGKVCMAPQTPTALCCFLSASSEMSIPLQPCLILSSFHFLFLLQ